MPLTRRLEPATRRRTGPTSAPRHAERACAGAKAFASRTRPSTAATHVLGVSPRVGEPRLAPPGRVISSVGRTSRSVASLAFLGAVMTATVLGGSPALATCVRPPAPPVATARWATSSRLVDVTSPPFRSRLAAYTRAPYSQTVRFDAGARTPQANLATARVLPRLRSRSR